MRDPYLIISCEKLQSDLLIYWHINFWSIIFLLQQSTLITGFPAPVPATGTLHASTYQLAVNEPSVPLAISCTVHQPDPGTAVYVVKLSGTATTVTSAQVTVFNAQQLPVRMIPFTTEALAGGQTIRLRTLPIGHYSLQIAVNGKTTEAVPLIIAP